MDIFIFLADGCPSPYPGGSGFVPYGALIRASCPDGFILVGPAQLTCLESGYFNETLPKCKG